MSVYWPIPIDHIALSLSPRGIIHASADPPFKIMSGPAGEKRTIVRTVCGIDAYAVAHSIIGQPDAVCIAPWPPPKLDRCTDCERILGKRLPVAGCDHWQQLVDL